MQELNKINNGGGEEEEEERRRRGTEREGREKRRREQKRLSRGRDTEVVSITLLFIINYLFTNLCLQCHSLHNRLAFWTPPPLQTTTTNLFTCLYLHTTFLTLLPPAYTTQWIHPAQTRQCTFLVSSGGSTSMSHQDLNNTCSYVIFDLSQNSFTYMFSNPWV